MTKGFYILAALLLAFTVVLFSLELSIRRPDIADPSDTSEHPYYLALQQAESVWHSRVDDDRLALEQAKRLFACSTNDSERELLIRALELLFPEALFLEDGVDVGMLNRFYGAVIQIDELQNLNPRVARIRECSGFGLIRLRISEAPEGAVLMFNATILASELPITQRELSLSGRSPHLGAFCFQVSVPGTTNAATGVSVKSRDLEYSDHARLTEPGFGEALRVGLEFQFRLLREGPNLISQPSPVSEIVELKAVTREGTRRYLPSTLVEDASVESAVRAICRALKEHRARVEKLRSSEP